MPSITVHKISALKAMRLCEPEIKNILEQNRISFLAGAQGTDNYYFFHFYRLMSGWRTKLYGWAAHHYRPKMFMLNMADYLKEHKTDNLTAYVLGYISHYCLDKYVHKIILEEKPSLYMHTETEQELEVMYALREGEDPYNSNREKYLYECTKDDNYEIGKMHTWLLKKVYRKVITCKPEDYSEAFLGWAQAFEHIDNPTEKQRKEILKRDKHLSFPLRCFLYKPVDEIKNNYDFEKLFKAIDKAVEESVSYIKLIYAYANGNAERKELVDTFDNINLQGSLVVPIEKKLPFLRKKPPME